MIQHASYPLIAYFSITRLKLLLYQSSFTGGVNSKVVGDKNKVVLILKQLYKKGKNYVQFFNDRNALCTNPFKFFLSVYLPWAENNLALL